MKRIFLTICAFAASGVLLLAQSGLNQTVQVTNQYTGDLVGAAKPANDCFVPDSLYHFDLNFDYGGLVKPYRGVDYYSPSHTEFRMEPRPLDGKRFYLKAGAGFTFAPQVDFTAIIKNSGRLKIDAYVNSDSYFGKYADIQSSGVWSGYESDNKAGLRARADWEKCSLIFALGYEGVFARSCEDLSADNAYNGGVFSLGVASKAASSFRYKVRADFDFGSCTAGREIGADLGGFFGWKFKNGSSMDIAADVNVTAGSSVIQGHYSGVVAVINPRYDFANEKVDLGLGVAMMIASGNAERAGIGNRSSFDLFPSVNFAWNAVRQKLQLYAGADMEGRLFGLRSQSLRYKFAFADEQLTIAKKFKVEGGLRGSFGGAFSYDLGFGWERSDGAPLLRVSSAMLPENRKVSITHADINDFFLAPSFDLNVRSFTLSGSMKYRFFTGKNAFECLPPAFTATLDAAYCWHSRLSVGIGADYESEYKAAEYSVPGFVNLRAEASYSFTQALRVFLSGRNLLGQKCQRIPLIARKGICITGGIVLNF